MPTCHIQPALMLPYGNNHKENVRLHVRLLEEPAVTGITVEGLLAGMHSAAAVQCSGMRILCSKMRSMAASTFNQRFSEQRRE